jgi:hypothetical protein
MSRRSSKVLPSQARSNRVSSLVREYLRRRLVHLRAAHPGHRRVLDLVLIHDEVEEPPQCREAVAHGRRFCIPLLARVNQELVHVALLQCGGVQRIRA